jgi:very-short-patch-repair endonuclease
MLLPSDAPSLFSLTPLARSMRKKPTRSERLMWRWLCGKQLGCRVRRQHVLHPFICDFVVLSHKLVIEVDGSVHGSPEARARDTWRDAVLASVYGMRVLRIDAELVERDVFAAVALVRAALS